MLDTQSWPSDRDDQHYATRPFEDSYFPVSLHTWARQARQGPTRKQAGCKADLAAGAGPSAGPSQAWQESTGPVTGVEPRQDRIRRHLGLSGLHRRPAPLDSPARDRYEDAVLLTGLPIGSPQEALDTACTVHLTGLRHEPEPLTPDELPGLPT